MTDAERRRKIAGLVDVLECDELRIAEHAISRLVEGRKEYGQWDVDDGRDYLAEALEEGIDLSLYLSGQLVRMEKKHHG